jgi:hypothetical protein
MPIDGIRNTIGITGDFGEHRVLEVGRQQHGALLN